MKINENVRQFCDPWWRGRKPADQWPSLATAVYQRAIASFNIDS